MLCSHTGIERLLNLLSLIYAIMLLLPHLDDTLLARAFRGELGTNDPTEESAVELVK